MVEAGGGLDDGGRAVAVGALHWGNAVGQRLPGFAAVRHGAGDAAEVDVTSGGEVVDAVEATLCIGAAVDLLVEGIEDGAQDLVGVGVVVAELRGLVPKAKAQ